MSHLPGQVPPDSIPRNRARAVGPNLWLTIVGIILCVLSGSTAAAQQNARKVLVVFSFSTRGTYSGLTDLKTRMQAAVPWPIDFYVEYLQGRQFDDKDYEESVTDDLRRKYDDLKLDLVVVENDPALEYVIRHRDELFPRVPIVFYDVDHYRMEGQKLWPGVTGVTTPIDVRSTIYAALHLHPATSTVAVIIGNSPYERYWLKLIHNELARHQVSEVDLVELPPSQLFERIAGLPPDTIVLYQLASQESPQPAIGYEEIAGWIGRRLPTYSTVPWGCLNHGCIGGDDYDGYQQIALVSKLVNRVLSGERPENIPVVHDTVHKFYADWHQLQKWHIPESALPPGTAVVFREPNLWQRYRGYVIAALAVILAQALLIAALLWQRARKRKAEAILRESEERFRLLAETTPSLIWICDSEGKVTYVNSRRLAFAGSDPIMGYSDKWMGHIHPDDLPNILNTISTALKDYRPYSYEYRIRRNDGEYRWMLDVASPRMNGDGSFAGFIGSAIDTTDLKVAQQALEKVSGQLIEAQEKERRRIARELHDDICQRLGLLSLELDQANRNSNGAHKNLEEIRNHCAEIANDVQAMSRHLHSSKLDYLGLVPAIKALCEEISKKHEVRVEFTARDVPQHLSRDISLALFRVTQEALHNAVKYSGASRFTVEVIGFPGEVQLEIRDWGIGFDVEEAKRNRGLGLVSMQERVNLVGGRFSIESRPGEGTTILAIAPLVVEKETSIESETVSQTGMA
jgi:PAS domain S-box-containing protein